MVAIVAIAAQTCRRSLLVSSRAVVVAIASVVVGVVA